MKTQKLIPFFILGTILIFALSGASAMKPDHPHYLYALSDLRAARWMIEHRPGDWQRSVDEVAAVKSIDEAISEIKKAAIDDGKNVNDHPKVDENPNHVGRLHAAVEYLKKAHKDVNKDEDNKFAQGLQSRALEHINEAIRLTEKAIHQ
jgi:tetratricopeptide (TPR) repeat protein